MDRTRVTPVAVIGMGCRLPGGIDSPDRLWEALLRGDDLVTEIPADRWDIDEYYDPEPGVPGRTDCKWGAYLDNVGDFDPEFFGIGEKEAIAIDPQHRLLLETSWEAMEHGGLTPNQMASRTGVFVGLVHTDYILVHADNQTFEGPYGNTGTNACFASERVAYAMGLQGPAITVDTACSSGLTAIHLACRSLHDGESDIALAGGVYVMLEPRRFASGSALGMLSATGRCHAFDVSADGFVSGEGCVMLALKRLPDALADGDRILAVIRGTAANQDGHTVNIATPSRSAQVAAYREALDVAGVDPATVGMVEAHGPGTPVGDPIEYASLAEVYGNDGPCALASVKTNFGHTQSAAGALGLMKAVLALQHGVVPQNLHFTALPDKLAAIETNLFVPQEITPWPGADQETPRRAAVSSYGMTGTNVHAIVEQAPVPAPESGAPGDTPATPGIDGALLFALSASSQDALRQTAARLADWVDAQGPELAPADLAYTLARRRGHRPVRTAVLAATTAELTEALREVATGEPPYPPAVGQDDRGPVWVFSGQGSQWAGMGADLLATEPVFAATIAAIEPLIAAESGFSVTEAMTAPEVVTGIDRVQPTLFAMQVALAATMKSYGVAPGAVIGHSLGESAAAVVAGALCLEDGVRVICRRSALMTRIAGAGAMASVELPAQQVLSELMARGVNDAVVAVVASPQSTVIGGATQTVRDLVAAWEQRDVLAREVAVDVASHSPQVDPILDELAEALAEISPLQPEIPYYSATSFDPREEPYCDAYYWVDNLRHTVRFAAAVTSRPRRRLPGLHRADPPPPADPRGRPDRPQPRHVRGCAGRHAPRTTTAPRAARTGRRPLRRRRRRRLRRALPHRPTDQRTTAHMEPPSSAARRHDPSHRPRQYRRRTPIAGLPRAPARGAGTPRLAGRGRHRDTTLAGRSPNPRRGRPSGSRLLRDGVGRSPRRPRRSLRSPRHPIRADVAARRRNPHRRHRHGRSPRRCPTHSRDQP